ncbi:MAG: ketol-acid reductoisomerase [candidate division Zixibacteria bacterium]|nr:ketol-acid reductoisomerase [candidate division Zixibacteria bacterium]
MSAIRKKLQKESTVVGSAGNLKYAVLGYGNQGRALALNLKDSKRGVVIGLPVRSKSIRKALNDNFSVVENVTDAVRKASVIVFAFPDHLHARTYQKDILPNLKKGQTLVFLHGTSIHFGLIQPPRDVDVVMLAPHAPGYAVREKFLSGESISCFWAIHQNYSRQARRRVFQFARSIGIATTKRTMIKTTFADEAVGDLFGEQVVLCGGLSELIHSGFQTLTKRGHSPDNAYLEVCYQIDLIVDLIKRFGIAGMYQRISVAARLGSSLSARRVIAKQTRKNMNAILKEIESGDFAQKLSSLTPAKLKRLDKNLQKLTSPEFEKSARKFAVKS